MTGNKQNEALTIREIEYSIQMKDKDSEFHELADILRSELTRFEDIRRKSDTSLNPIREFLRTNIERSIVIRENTKVYFLNYQEKGTLTIQFTLLVITRYVNYGSIRQALDFLIKDTIGGYFEELIERHLPVEVSVHCIDNELYEIPAYLPPKEQPIAEVIAAKPQHRDYLSIILASLAILLALTAGIISLIPKSNNSEKNSPAQDLKDKYYELLIDKQVKEAFEKEKFNYNFYRNLGSPVDSVNYSRYR